MRRLAAALALSLLLAACGSSPPEAAPMEPLSTLEVTTTTLLPQVKAEPESSFFDDSRDVASEQAEDEAKDREFMATNPLDCKDFSTQAEAQRIYDMYPGDPNHLDREGDGRACELLP